jgi:hypothetical protein
MLTDLSAHLTLTPLIDSNRALEVGGRVDLFRLQVFAHNADLVEEACRGLGITVQYRSLTGACFDASEQFAGLRRLPNPPVRGLQPHDIAQWGAGEGTGLDDALG